MRSLQPHPRANNTAPPDPRAEVARLEALLAERRAELSALQEAFRAFKARYTQVVGSRLAELSEVEHEVREAERRTLGAGPDERDEEDEEHDGFYQTSPAPHGKPSLRRLFWSVARLFHPDHAADDAEARRRHAIMAEAGRAYSEGDVDSLHTLLGDEHLQFYCASTSAADDTDSEDLPARLLNLKEELRTAEFGIKRIRQDKLHRLMLEAAADAAEGRDRLAQTAASLDRQIAKARHRLAHLS